MTSHQFTVNDYNLYPVSSFHANEPVVGNYFVQYKPGLSFVQAKS